MSQNPNTAKREYFEQRTLYVQIVSAVIGTLIGSGVLGLLGWNAITSMETKEAVTRLEERTSNVTSTFRDLAETVANTRADVQENTLRLRGHDYRIDQNAKELRRLRERLRVPVPRPIPDDGSLSSSGNGATPE